MKQHMNPRCETLLARAERAEAALAEAQRERDALEAEIAESGKYVLLHRQKRRAERAEAALAEAQRKIDNYMEANAALRRSAVRNRDRRVAAEAWLDAARKALREIAEATCIGNPAAVAATERLASFARAALAADAAPAAEEE